MLRSARSPRARAWGAACCPGGWPECGMAKKRKQVKSETTRFSLDSGDSCSVHAKGRAGVRRSCTGPLAWAWDVVQRSRGCTEGAKLFFRPLGASVPSLGLTCVGSLVRVVGNLPEGRALNFVSCGATRHLAMGSCWRVLAGVLPRFGLPWRTAGAESRREFALGSFCDIPSLVLSSH